MLYHHILDKYVLGGSKLSNFKIGGSICKMVKLGGQKLQLSLFYLYEYC
jgi:hypothetical protein